MDAGSAGQAVPITAPMEREGSRMILRRWRKRAGHEVIDDEPLVELETDKAMLELSAPAAGVLEITLEEGCEIEPGQLLGRVIAAKSNPDAGPALSEALRRLLASHAIDPSLVRGTGRGGRITREDVDTCIAEQGPHHDGGASASVVPRTKARVPHQLARLRMGEHLLRSLHTAPHVTATFNVDFTSVLAHQAAHRAAYATQAVRLTLTTYIIAAIVSAMKAVPEINGRWHADCFELFEDVSVGIGVALPDHDLVVPVMHRAQQLSLMEIATHLSDLQTRALGGTLAPSDTCGGTFTISNYGVSGALFASPIIIHQPQSAILGVGALEKRAVVRQADGRDGIAIRPQAYVSLTVDHRAINGSQASAWLKHFSSVIEQWPAAVAQDS